MRLQKVPPALQVSATSMASSRSGAQYSPSAAPRIACTGRFSERENVRKVEQ
jgi:hypothetical protein